MPSRLSVCCPSVTFRYHNYIGWNTSKIILRMNCLRYLLGMVIIYGLSGPTGTHPKFEWNWGRAMSTKPAISLKRCKTGPRLLRGISRKSLTCFRMVQKSMTLDDLERPKRTVAEKNILQSPPEKVE